MKLTIAMFIAWFALGSAYFIRGETIEMLLCFVLSSVWYSIYKLTKKESKND